MKKLKLCRDVEAFWPYWILQGQVIDFFDHGFTQARRGNIPDHFVTPSKSCHIGGAKSFPGTSQNSCMEWSGIIRVLLGFKLVRDVKNAGLVKLAFKPHQDICTYKREPSPEETSRFIFLINQSESCYLHRIVHICNKQDFYVQCGSKFIPIELLAESSLL